MLHRHVGTVVDELAIPTTPTCGRACGPTTTTGTWPVTSSGDAPTSWPGGRTPRPPTGACSSSRRDGIVTLQGDNATGRYYVHERNVRRDDRVAELWACYDDRHVRTGDGWKLQTRVLHVFDHTLG